MTIWWDMAPGRANNQCKGLQVGMGLVCLRSSKKAAVTGAEHVRRLVGNETRGPGGQLTERTRFSLV